MSAGLLLSFSVSYVNHHSQLIIGIYCLLGEIIPSFDQFQFCSFFRHKSHWTMWRDLPKAMKTIYSVHYRYVLYQSLVCGDFTAICLSVTVCPMRLAQELKFLQTLPRRPCVSTLLKTGSVYAIVMLKNIFEIF